ncbi:DEAD/DEAH box helicase [Deinococcus cellulosilyticus]|uniref:Helicase n=1 Tax=Deinococcus cellulosilyticus (strain DSM 18568 / NBRC 106333 / KACC 11606 / 5516J-15) TaxID=1223518 RepID=A0A511N8N2_DEIC1|nr:helicase-related protein [Deinococcus cellulosilyticus]GEM49162.1 helicase [Deinococcus cellulosilyticus NBRC 106333 = KACC 11606]
MIPVPGTLIKHRSRPERRAKVLEVVQHPTPRAKVQWDDQMVSHLPVQELRSGLMVGAEVTVYRMNLSDRLGEGKIITQRVFAGMEQVLVHLYQTNDTHWFPWQCVRVNTSPYTLLAKGRLPRGHHPERFRLQQLAHLIQHWQHNTGALSQLDIDPLPHQVSLVHRILTSGSLNWLIADDVGLGKTISVGLLITALQSRGLRRFLIVVPAGLTRQWQEEMSSKFNLRDFQIYGQDFFIQDPRHWHGKNQVIVSLDRAKQENHLETLLAADDWDYVIFDEAHRLTRSQYGNSFVASERYELASHLRNRSRNVLLLTGTPHQGKMDRFRALLELLRPGEAWRRQLDRVQIQPEVLRDVIIRNRKSEVTDKDGKLLFKHKSTHRVDVPLSETEKIFDRQLRLYLKNGYARSRELGHKGLAIGFVMTVYRKLASSSFEAITSALERRLQKLNHEDESRNTNLVEDERYVEQEEQADSRTDSTPFFVGEEHLLKDLIDLGRRLVPTDSKKQTLMEHVLPQVLKQSPHEKLLVFTEYRSTQEDICKALEKKHPGKVRLLNGSMSLEERRQVIEDFNSEAQFLISTEAGGEGLNLQRNCHIMVNYDLPWNPMRLVQRVGRLYRYGQDRNVVVFNLQSADTLDSEILSTMYESLSQVTADLCKVSGDYGAGLQDEILGQLASALQVEDLLAQAAHATREQTRSQLEEALFLARDAAARQQELLSHASGFSQEWMKDQLQVTPEHLQNFLEGMVKITGIEVTSRLHRGEVWELKLPEQVRKETGIRHNLKVTFNRNLALRSRETTHLDIGHPLLRHLLKVALGVEFSEPVSTLHGRGVLVGAVLVWQNDQGMILREEYVLMHFDGSQWQVNPPEMLESLLENEPPGHDKAMPLPREPLAAALEQVLVHKARNRTLPVDARVVGVAWLNDRVEVTG